MCARFTWWRLRRRTSRWWKARAPCAARAPRESAASAERRPRPAGISRATAVSRSATAIPRSAPREPAATICASTIPARDKCPAGLAMWCSKFGKFAKRVFILSFRGPRLWARGISLGGWRPWRDRREIPRRPQRAPRNDKQKLWATSVVDASLVVALPLSAALSLLFLAALPAQATTYYVDNCVTVGSDSNNGTSPSTPWLTVAHVNAQSFNPGDSVLFERSCAWYGTALTVPSSGASGSPITF